MPVLLADSAPDIRSPIIISDVKAQSLVHLPVPEHMRITAVYLWGCMFGICLMVSFLHWREVFTGCLQHPADLEPWIQAIAAHAKRSRDTFVVSSDLPSWLQRQRGSSPFSRMTVGVNDIVFLVMASATERIRVVGQKASWMRWATNVIILADAADDELGTITLPEIANKSSFADAQWRQVYGMKWLSKEKPELKNKKWFFLVDDDTWVNVPLLCDYLSWFPSTLPLSFSHIYIMYSNQAVYNGGAGMLFSNTAFHTLASALLTEACPLQDVDPGFVNNDNILSSCAFSTGVLKVSSSKFSSYEGVLHLEHDIVDTSWLDQITVHKIRETALAQRMYCWCNSLRGSDVDKVCLSS